jgi:hypothetical protein
MRVIWPVVFGMIINTVSGKFSWPNFFTSTGGGASHVELKTKTVQQDSWWKAAQNPKLRIKQMKEEQRKLIQEEQQKNPQEKNRETNLNWSEYNKSMASSKNNIANQLNQKKSELSQLSKISDQNKIKKLRQGIDNLTKMQIFTNSQVQISSEILQK